MKKYLFVSLVLMVAVILVTKAQESDKATIAKGINYIQTKTYSEEDDKRIL
jgi:hypothetical protein